MAVAMALESPVEVKSREKGREEWKLGTWLYSLSW
jgi:hypothetical protein